MNILPHHGCMPKVPQSVYIAPSADLIGELEIGEESSVWFQVVIRADVNWIKIGKRTNIQDSSMLHVTRRTSPLTVGDEVTVGHRVMLHGCTVERQCLIGMGAILLDDCVIGEQSIVGAGAVVTKGTVIPPRSLVMGMPAKVIRPLKQEEIDFLAVSAQNYVNDSREYLNLSKGK